MKQFLKQFSEWYSECFLFQTRPEAGWPLKRKVGFWAWNLGWLLAAAAGLAAVSLMLAVGHYSLDLARG